MPDFFKYLQEKVVFLPAALDTSHTFDFETPFEEYFWETPFGGKISCIHFKTTNPVGVIVYYHGNSDNLARWGSIAEKLTKFSYDVLVMDYRGYGKSSGPRNEEYLYSDAQATYDFARKNYGENNTVIYGRSLGGAFAVKSGAQNQPKMVILEAAFYNLQDVVNRWLPVQVTDRVAPRMRYHFLSNQNIQHLHVPLYQFHGSLDKIVPVSSGRKLFEYYSELRPDVEKQFIEIKEAGHDDLADFPLYRETLKTVF